MSSLKTGMVSAFVSRAIPRTQVVLNTYFFKEGRKRRRKDHEASWPVLSQMREMCTSEVDRGQGAANCVLSNRRNLWFLPKSQEVVLRKELVS